MLNKFAFLPQWLFGSVWNFERKLNRAPKRLTWEGSRQDLRIQSEKEKGDCSHSDLGKLQKLWRDSENYGIHRRLWVASSTLAISPR